MNSKGVQTSSTTTDGTGDAAAMADNDALTRNMALLIGEQLSSPNNLKTSNLHDLKKQLEAIKAP